MKFAFGGKGAQEKKIEHTAVFFSDTIENKFAKFDARDAQRSSLEARIASAKKYSSLFIDS